MTNKLLTFFLLLTVSLEARIEVGDELRNPFEKASGNVQIKSSKPDIDPSIAILNGKFIKASSALRKLDVKGVMENKDEPDNCVLLIDRFILRKNSIIRGQSLNIDGNIKITSVTKNEFKTQITIDSETRELIIPILNQ